MKIMGWKDFSMITAQDQRLAINRMISTSTKTVRRHHTWDTGYSWVSHFVMASLVVRSVLPSTMQTTPRVVLDCGEFNGIVD